MRYKRTIKFQYFRIFCQKRGNDGNFGEKELYNLTEWISKAKGNQQKAISFGKNMARIDIIKYSKITELWGIRLLKLRNTNPPTKAKDGEEAEAILLEDGEYIGEDVSMLYDRYSNILMVQSNRFSLSISKIEEFMNYVNENVDEIITIDPIGNFGASDCLRQKEYKRFEVPFANLNVWQDEDKKPLKGIMTSIKEMGGYTASVKIGVGKGKGNFLNKQNILDFVQNLGWKKDFVKSARVKIEDPETGEDEGIFDLIEEVFHDYITFELDAKETLTYDMAIGQMTRKFNDRKQELYEAIGIKMR